MQVYKLRDAVTSTGAGSSLPTPAPVCAFQAIVAGTGSVTAVIAILVSNDDVNFMTASTITLSGTTSATDGTVLDLPWKFVKGNVTTLTGTGAIASLLMSVA